ncbi:Excinuclease ABC, A subunit, partial [Candidatus Arthromitus sp. SFB-4]
MEYIEIKGARVNNLKNCDVKFPRNKLVLFTGVSGSGKTSLAFDTLYAEGQRRYVESLSTYARQFLGQMDKPEVDAITGLSPAISIDQKTTSRNPRSTVGTVTEIYDYLRLLYSRAGTPHCYKCGKEIKRQTIDQIVDSIMDIGEGSKIQIFSPIVKNQKGRHEKLIENIKMQGFVRARIDGEVYDLSEETIDLNKNKKHTIEILVDRIVIKNSSRGRVFESVESSLKFSDGLV